MHTLSNFQAFPTWRFQWLKTLASKDTFAELKDDKVDDNSKVCSHITRCKNNDCVDRRKEAYRPWLALEEVNARRRFFARNKIS